MFPFVAIRLIGLFAFFQRCPPAAVAAVVVVAVDSVAADVVVVVVVVDVPSLVVQQPMGKMETVPASC